MRKETIIPSTAKAEGDAGSGRLLHLGLLKNPSLERNSCLFVYIYNYSGWEKNASNILMLHMTPFSLIMASKHTCLVSREAAFSVIMSAVGEKSQSSPRQPTSPLQIVASQLPPHGVYA